MNRFPFVLSLLVLASCGGGCGGASAPSAPAGPTVGGGLADGPGALTPGATLPPVPGPVSPATTAGPWFGVLNASTARILSFAWWETRPNYEGPYTEPHWFNIVPIVGVAPGQVWTLTVGKDGRPWYEPAPGLLSVRAYLSDGRMVDATIEYAPEAAAVWIVR